MNKIRKEKMEKEEGEIRDRPQISKNSQKIANKMKIQTGLSFYDRISNGIYQKKKINDISQIKNMNSISHTPHINEQSKYIKRSIDDLYSWQMRVNRKKTQTSDFLNKSLYQNTPKINNQSNNILKQRNPDYLNKKVEDRLLEQGIKNKLKLEEEKEHIFESASMGKNYIPRKDRSLYYCTGEVKIVPPSNLYKHIPSKLFDYENKQKMEKQKRCKSANKYLNNRNKTKVKNPDYDSFDSNLYSCRNYIKKDRLAGLDQFQFYNLIRMTNPIYIK